MKQGPPRGGVCEARMRSEGHPAGERLERRTKQEHAAHRPEKLDFLQEEVGNWKVFNTVDSLGFPL